MSGVERDHGWEVIDGRNFVKVDRGLVDEKSEESRSLYLRNDGELFEDA